MFTGGSAYWSHFMLQQGRWDAAAKVRTPDEFLFSVQGPQSLAILERATGAELKPLRFNHWRQFSISGVPLKILRTGITGALGYELHGPSEHGNTVWAKVVAAGQ